MPSRILVLAKHFHMPQVTVHLHCCGSEAEKENNGVGEWKKLWQIKTNREKVSIEKA